MDEKQVEEMLETLRRACSRMTLAEFCRRTGFYADSYAEEKLREFRRGVAALGAFDTAALAKILID